MAFSETLIGQVWEKGRALSTRDRNHWRQDECGAWMSREQYGNTASEFGWKIENVTAGGNDSIEHLRPFHHGNHFNRGTGLAHCTVMADREHVNPTDQISPPKNRTS